jgi:hypothetical protein
VSGKLKVVFVGDRPKARNKRAFQDAGCAEKLHRWAQEIGAQEVHMTNQVLKRMPREVRKLMAAEFKVVALGKSAEKALSKLKVPHYPMPHPSGRNRLLNDTEYEAFCVDDCKRWLSEGGAPKAFGRPVNVKGKGNSWK